ncbi:MAG: lipoate--protein ligase family protein [Acidimicrobiales bacterium]
MKPAWDIRRVVADPEALHARPLAERALGPGAPGVTLVSPTRSALVLGSLQPISDVDHGRAAERQVAVVRRHGGGGAVLVEPGALVWADVVIGREDRRWEPDVGRSFGWLGRVWVDALEAAGALRGGQVARSHTGRLCRTPWSSRVCFAGLGPGEVTIEGRKVVGISQRRNRDVAVFQCAALLVWDPAALVELLAFDVAERPAVATALNEVAAGIGRGRGDALEAAFLEALAGS